MHANSTDPPSDPSNPKATPKEWFGLCVLSIACLIYSMDLSVLFLAIPAIVKDLSPSAAELLWINDIYGFMVAGFLVTMGTLGDRIGRRKLLLIGALCFGMASALAAFSTTSFQLILSRALLGIAGATIAPSTLSLVVNIFKNEGERNRAIGIWGAAFALGGLIGPLLGGLLLEYFHWGSVFLINIPIMLGLLAVAPFVLPEYRNGETEGIDLVSVALSLGSVLPIIYSFKHMAANGFSIILLAPIVLGLAIGSLFIRRQRQLAHPLIDLNLFRNTAFSASLLVNLAGVFFIFGIFLYQNLYLQLVIGLSPLRAALWSIPSASVFTIMSFQAYRLSDWLGPVKTVLAGLVVNALGAFTMALAAYNQNLIGVLAASVLVGLGFVPVILTTTGLIVGSAPPARAGSASAISETGAEFGGALGVAFLGGLGTAIYRWMMSGADTAGLTESQLAAVTETLAGAVDVAATLGAAQEPSWLASAKYSFSLGFSACALAAGITLLLLAAIVRKVYANGHGTAPARPAH